MRITAVQIQPVAGNVEANLAAHGKMVRRAVAVDARLVLFPELSLTGYEPSLGARMAREFGLAQLGELQSLSDEHGVVIMAGLPAPAPGGTTISMAILQPHQPVTMYAKQRLHHDESPWFVPGRGQVVVSLGHHMAAPAICHESVQTEHAEGAAALGANVYLASAAKSASGAAAAFAHYPSVASRHRMTVLFANALGPSDDFVSAGQSAVWDASGVLVASLDGEREGLLTYDLDTRDAIITYASTAGG